MLKLCWDIKGLFLLLTLPFENKHTNKKPRNLCFVFLMPSLSLLKN